MVGPTTTYQCGQNTANLCQLFHEVLFLACEKRVPRNGYHGAHERLRVIHVQTRTNRQQKSCSSLSSLFGVVEVKYDRVTACRKYAMQTERKLNIGVWFTYGLPGSAMIGPLA